MLSFLIPSLSRDEARKAVVQLIPDTGKRFHKLDAGEGLIPQCDISTGVVIRSNRPRLVPPSNDSRSREWP
jgi:hypothetical protein